MHPKDYSRTRDLCTNSKKVIMDKIKNRYKKGQNKKIRRQK